ncbi:hypothetical protein SO694_00134016 [Aureococcus anophagefferens]|uniref:Bromo domain-containing protein n=1 Tax=Aureococcus anophagefferens TaxID=44056 RepID=A0ABR1GG83_AURAN
MADPSPLIESVLFELLAHPSIELFLRPVAEAYPEVYGEIIERPLDLNAVRRARARGDYSAAACARARAAAPRPGAAHAPPPCAGERFNEQSPQYRELARHLRTHFDEMWARRR